MVNETNYGNFAEPKAEGGSKRGEAVIIAAIDSLERAMKKIKVLERKNKNLNEELSRCYGQLEAYETRQIYKGELK